MEIEVKEYKTPDGKLPFKIWFDGLDDRAAVTVRTAIARIEAGNYSNVKSVGDGVFERKIDWGAGYRIYFAKENEYIFILLGGGTKRKQSADIAKAKILWKEYKCYKKQGK